MDKCSKAFLRTPSRDLTNGVVCSELVDRKEKHLLCSRAPFIPCCLVLFDACSPLAFPFTLTAVLVSVMLHDEVEVEEVEEVLIVALLVLAVLRDLP